MTLLHVDAIEAGYGAQTVIRGLSLMMAEGDFAALIGPNGHGKTTLLRAISGLVRLRHGSITLGGIRIDGLRPDEVAAAGIVHVPQGDMLFPEMTVLENLELGGFTLAGERAKLARNMDQVFGMFPRMADRRAQLAGTLSGGEQQMLAIGRALMSSPRVIALDEPSLGLSPKFVELVFATLIELKNAGYTIVMVEQKASRALEVSDWGYVMHLGRVAFSGAAAALRVDDKVKRAYLGELPPELESRFTQTEDA